MTSTKKVSLKVLKPLIGKWECSTDSPMGMVHCTRSFQYILNQKYIELTCIWDFGSKQYEERALYGMKEDTLQFWSFTNDGKSSHGCISQAEDIADNAICFEAEMPAGTARMVYWFDQSNQLNWVVESKTKKGWNRFVKHSYQRVNEASR